MANQQTLTAVFAALADPTRRAVVHRLGRGAASVSELATPHAIALPTFLRHLGVLEAAGLVRTRKVGRVRTCSLSQRRLSVASEWLVAQREMWTTRLDQLDAYLLEMAEAEAEGVSSLAIPRSRASTSKVSLPSPLPSTSRLSSRLSSMLSSTPAPTPTPTPMSTPSRPKPGPKPSPKP